MSHVPKLEPHCGSWVIVDRTTGKPVMETFSQTIANAINQARYDVVTAAQWLSSLNSKPQLPKLTEKIP